MSAGWGLPYIQLNRLNPVQVSFQIFFRLIFNPGTFLAPSLTGLFLSYLNSMNDPWHWLQHTGHYNQSIDDWTFRKFMQPYTCHKAQSQKIWWEFTVKYSCTKHTITYHRQYHKQNNDFHSIEILIKRNYGKIKSLRSIAWNKKNWDNDRKQRLKKWKKGPVILCSSKWTM